MAKYVCIWVRTYWFSVTSFSKWLPGGHIRFFGFWMAWFRQCNSSLLWNYSFKFHVHVLCGCRQKPNDCQLCRFQNGCLLILNNVQLRSTHCPLPPSPMWWGILVDHWSRISSLFSGWVCTCVLSVVPSLVLCVAVITRSIGPHIRARDFEFASSKSHLYSVVVIAILCVISWYVGPRYNGTRMYTTTSRAGVWTSWCR